MNAMAMLRQSNAFGFVQTGKDFSLPQFFWSEHESAQGKLH
jgi:hypothetical protein